MNAIAALDTRAILWVNAHHAAPLDWLFLGASLFGDAFGIFLLVGLYVTLPRGRAQLRPFIVGASVAWLALEAIRRVVHRTRPCVALAGQLRMIVEPIIAANSWPSGHAAVGGAIAVGAWMLGWPARGALVGLGLLVGLSRIYLALHYPSDVASGFLLGGSITGIACTLWRRYVEPPAPGGEPE